MSLKERLRWWDWPLMVVTIPLIMLGSLMTLPFKTFVWVMESCERVLGSEFNL